MRFRPESVLIFDLKMGEQSFPVRKADLLKRLGLFQLHPSLLGVDEYEVKAQVSLSSFSAFVNIVSGAPITVSEANCTEIQLLAEEFGFDALREACTEFSVTRDKVHAQIVLWELELENVGVGRRVTITTGGGSKTYETLTSLAEIREFAAAVTRAKEGEIVIEGIEGRIWEKALEVVCNNTTASLGNDETQRPFLVLMFWELHKLMHSIYFIWAGYCVDRLLKIALTDFEAARLLLLSQCDPQFPGEFKRLPTADSVIINDAITFLRHQKNGRWRDASALLRTLKGTGQYEGLLDWFKEG
jgi:hypothetical protein